MHTHTHDFGTILAPKTDQSLMHQFRIFHAGEVTYTIRQIVYRKSCCTALDFSHQRFSPGQDVAANLTCKIGTNRGRLTWFARTIPTDHENPVYHFEASAVVLPRATFTERSFQLARPLQLQERDEIAGRLQVFYRSSETLKSPHIGVSDKRLNVILGEPNSSECSLNRRFLCQETPVKIAVRAGTKTGRHQAALEFTWSEWKYTLRSSVDWEVVSPIVAHPKALLFGTNPDNKRIAVRLESRNGNAFQVLSVDPPAGYCAIVQQVGETARPVHTVLVNASVDGEINARSYATASVLVRTNQGDLSIPVFVAKGTKRRSHRSLKNVVKDG